MSVNKVILVGRLGKDVEMNNGVAKVSLATTDKIKKKDSNEYEVQTEWHNLVFFGSLANIAHQFLSKGSQIYIEGKIKTSEYTKDNIKRYSTSIIVNSLQMLGSKNASDNVDDYKKKDTDTATAFAFGASTRNTDIDEDLPF